MPPNDTVSAILSSLSPNGAGEQRRTGLQTSADRLAAGTGTDDPYIRTMESFHGMGHEEMYAMVQTMVPDAIGQLAQACHSISNSLPLAFGFAILRNTISERWEGAAADAAAQATEKLAATSGQLTSSIAAIAVKLDILSSAAADVKASVPQSASSDGVLSQLPLSPLAAETSETSREAARLEAVRRLEAIYVPNYRDVGTNVPQLPEPYAPSGDGAGSDDVLNAHGTFPQGSNPWGTADSNTSSASGEGDSSADSESSADGDSAGDQGMMPRLRPQRMPRPLPVWAPGLDPARPHRLPPRMRRMRPVPVRSRAAARVPGVTVAESAEGRGPVPGDRASGVRRRARAGRTTSATPSPTRAVWFRVARSRPVAPRPAQGRLPLLQRRPR